MVERMPASGKQECRRATLSRSPNGFNPLLWNFAQIHLRPFRLHVGFGFLAAQTSGWRAFAKTIPHAGLCAKLPGR
jgi:hypothetical protein